MLEKIKKGKEVKPPRLVIYGAHGLGKSTFALEDPRSVAVQTEDGLRSIDCHKFPLCTSTDDVYEQLQSLISEKHDYRVVVIDSVDWLERIIFSDIIKANNAKTIDDFNVKALAYNGGRKRSLVVWDNILSQLDRLNQKGMVICLIGHSTVDRFESPTSAPYHRYLLDIYNEAAEKLYQWADLVGFLDYQTTIKTEELGWGQTARHGESSGQRVLYVEKRPGFEAKNHYNLPPVIRWERSGNWQILMNMIREFYGTRKPASDTKDAGAVVRGEGRENNEAQSGGGEGGDKGPGEFRESSGSAQALFDGKEEAGGVQEETTRTGEAVDDGGEQPRKAASVGARKRAASNKPEASGVQA